MTIQCAWCRIKMGEKEPLSDKNVSHSICELCKAAFWGEEDSLTPLQRAALRVVGAWDTPRGEGLGLAIAALSSALANEIAKKETA